MKLIKYFSLILLAVFLTTACSEETFEEINTDPTQLSDVDMRLILPQILTQASFNKGATPGRMAGIVMQQYEGFDAQQVQYTQYTIGSDAFNNYWNLGMYTGVLRSCQVLIDKAVTEEASFYGGVAKIIMASEYGLLTSFFGDIPYSDALKGTESLKPLYDKQEDVYKGVQAMLHDAISDLGSGTGYAGGDLIFDGDAAAWIETAYALKARFQMHLQKRDGAAASKVLTLLGSAFKSLDDQPTFNFGTAQTDNWSLDQFGLQRANTLIIDTYFADLMTGDPRQDRYMFTDGTTWFFHEPNNADLVYAKSNSAIPLISYVEVKFLEAEALARTGADASAALTAAIEASMIQSGAIDYADYVTANGDVSGLSQDDAVKKIVEEAYRAYYGFNFFETWSNYRRTGYPAITPNPNGANGFNPSGVVPRRFPYPVSEQQTNLANLEAAQAAQNGALLDVAVWAFE
jgi:hypothetical protein